MFVYGGHALWRTLASVKPKPSESSTYCSHYSTLQKFVDVCECVRVCTHQPPSAFPNPPFPPPPSLPPSHFSFTPSQLCSLTHSEPGQKLAEQLLQSETPVLTLTQTARTL